MISLLGLFGCGGSDAPGEKPGAQSKEPDAEQVAEPEVVSPLELMQRRDQAGPSEPAEVEARPVPDLETPVDNAVHPIAGRSAFPEDGEAVDHLIPAKKLSNEDQFASAVDEGDIPDVVPWDQAKKYAGHTITIEGKIIDVGSINEGSVNFLNFHKDWRGKFYMVVFGELAKTLPKSVEATFLGKTVRVTGEVEDHRGRPQIKILSMDQVQFVGE